MKVYIAVDNEGVIQGLGSSRREAVGEAIEFMGKGDYPTYPCSEELEEEVLRGGNIAWGLVHGIATLIGV